MPSIRPQMRILVAVDPVDLRMGIDGMAELVPGIRSRGGFRMTQPKIMNKRMGGICLRYVGILNGSSYR